MHLQLRGAWREANHYTADRERQTQMGDARVTPRDRTTTGIAGWSGWAVFDLGRDRLQIDTPANERRVFTSFLTFVRTQIRSGAP
jgi:hypothetical protein